MVVDGIIEFIPAISLGQTNDVKDVGNGRLIKCFKTADSEFFE